MEVLKSIPEIPFPEYYEFFMDWKTVVSIASAYVVGVSLFNPSASKAKASRVTAKNNGATNVSKSSPFMTALVFTHNLVLAIYSAVTFYNMVIGLHNNYTRDASLSQAVKLKKKKKKSNSWQESHHSF
jgi:hypothetical protein